MSEDLDRTTAGDPPSNATPADAWNAASVSAIEGAASQQARAEVVAGHETATAEGKLARFGTISTMVQSLAASWLGFGTSVSVSIYGTIRAVGDLNAPAADASIAGLSLHTALSVGGVAVATALSRRGAGTRSRTKSTG